ncbi:MAG: secondary thiamine-phosphate synthase enzyme YjbQ [Acidimicrobiia bacterium]|nr:secondary thiamine-phosphate synthase enzyme YjbQ [Acidimicrobiia bacterium]
MVTETLTVSTGRRRAAVDLTRDLAAFLDGRGDGLLTVFVPHATAGVAVIETGAGSVDDLWDRIDELLPRADDLYRHRHGSPGHGADHVLPAFVAPSVTVPVVDGAMTLGTWQSIVLIDPNEDNPQRTVVVSFIEG